MPRCGHLPLLVFLALLTELVTVGQAAAQGASEPPAGPAGWRIGIGVAPVVSPVFEGADDYGFSVFPDLRFQYRDRFFASVPEGIRYHVVNGPRLVAGPIARIRFGREEDNGGSPFLVTGSVGGLDGLGDIDAAGEFGGFVSYRMASWRWRAELRHGFGGHEGVVGDLSLDHTGGTRAVRYAIGPRLRFGSADFVDTYYGVDAAQSARSGLPRFAADGGLTSAGIGASVIVPRGERMTLIVFGGYDRLLGDIADSPLIEIRGYADQISLGASLSWQFDFGGNGR